MSEKKRKTRWVLVVAISVVVAVGLLYLVRRSDRVTAADTPGLREEGGAIFFLRVRERGLSMERRICRYDVATGKVHVLTREPTSGGGPSPSPDGTKVAFIRYEPSGDNGDVCVLDVLSGEIQNLTADSLDRPRRHIGHVAWSPDGKLVVFRSLVFIDVPGGDWGHERLHVVEPDGSNLREVADMDRFPRELMPKDFADVGGVEVAVSDAGLRWWGPGSRRLRIAVYFERPPGTEDLMPETKVVSYLAELDEDDLSLRWLGPMPEPEEIGGLPSELVTKAWSPDGKRLAYSARSEEALGTAVDTLYVVDADGISNDTLVYKGGQQTIIDHFAWSPSGRYLVLELWGARGYAGLYVVSAEGGEPIAITRGGWRTKDVFPTWVACPPLLKTP